MTNEEKIRQAAEILSKAKRIVGFTGAGTSAESGIPPFRGEGGIWNKYDPNSLDIDFYYSHTKDSWKIIREVFYNFFSNKEIKPNPGHEVLAKWEKEGRLQFLNIILNHLFGWGFFVFVFYVVRDTFYVISRMYKVRCTK